ncbi:hypothetical protein Pelo_228 [Pelomyxa schiedti]|nr:hypothetical protein Pelo_228 [Pelomyxa schiedti]
MSSPSVLRRQQGSLSRSDSYRARRGFHKMSAKKGALQLDVKTVVVVTEAVPLDDDVMVECEIEDILSPGRQRKSVSPSPARRVSHLLQSPSSAALLRSSSSFTSPRPVPSPAPQVETPAHIPEVTVPKESPFPAELEVKPSPSTSEPEPQQAAPEASHGTSVNPVQPAQETQNQAPVPSNPGEAEEPTETGPESVESGDLELYPEELDDDGDDDDQLGILEPEFLAAEDPLAPNPELDEVQYSETAEHTQDYQCVEEPPHPILLLDTDDDLPILVQEDLPRAEKGIEYLEECGHCVETLTQIHHNPKPPSTQCTLSPALILLIADIVLTYYFLCDILS